MSGKRIEPDFGPEFWATVSQRAERVRDLTREELEQAEQDLLAVQPEAEVVPVFPAPFWMRVNKRAAKVRRMALDELSDAEDRLVNQPQTAGPARAGRASRPALPLVPALRALGLKMRANPLGFVTAVLIALVMVPQVIPITSAALSGEDTPLSKIFGLQSDVDDGSAEGSESSASSSGPDGAASGTAVESGTRSSERSSGTGSGSAFEGVVVGRSGEPSRAGQSGGDGANDATSGASGESAAGGSGTASSAAAGSSASGEDGATAAPPPPAAPSNLLVTAVDDSSVRLRWKDNSSDETGFELERRGQTANGRQITGTDTKSFVWTGLSSSREYCFRVRALNGGGVSDWVPENYNCVSTHAAQPGGGTVVLSAKPCSDETTLSAGSGRQETEILFRNQTAQTVRIYALGRNGVREQAPITLAPQDSTSISTFLGNPYVVTTDDVAATCVAIFSGESWRSVANIT